MAERLFTKRATDPTPSIEDIMNKNAVAKLRRELAGVVPPSNQEAGCQPGRPPLRPAGHVTKPAGDTDLIASMAKRLSILEKDLATKSKQLEQVQADNVLLRSKLEATTASCSTTNDDKSGNSASQLQQENVQLNQQLREAQVEISELKTFLADYGMVWVGDQHQRQILNKQPSEARRPTDNGDSSPAGPIRSEFRRRSYTGGSSSHNGTAPQPPPKASTIAAAAASPRQNQLPFSMPELLGKVDELNQLAGDGIGKLMPCGGSAAPGQAHMLHTPEPVRLTIFSDGLQLHRAAPKPFADQEAERVVSDIMDGYFPSQLRNEFPQGVPIKVVDRTKESYKDLMSPRNQPGNNGSNVHGNVKTFHDLEAGVHDHSPMSKNEFLSRLPQAVIKNGKVIDVRAGIGKVLDGNPSNSPSTSEAVSVVRTSTDALLTTSQRNCKGPVLPPPSREGPRAGDLPPRRLSALGESSECMQALRRVSGSAAGLPCQAPLPAPAGPQITTLQVKSEDGQQTLILKLQYDDTVGSLRSYIDTHRAQQPGAKLTAYEIRSAFPPRKYEDSETLRDAGLVPNATLFMRHVS